MRAEVTPTRLLTRCGWPDDQAAGARPARGFTLLELLVALAVLSVALIALHQAFGSSILVTAATRGLWKAMVYADNELARWERMDSAPVSVAQGEFDPDDSMAGYRWTREVSDVEPLPGVIVRKVQLELFWEEGDIPRSYRSQIYVEPTDLEPK